ncbi:unnamed protein product [Paramecium primaurelia]|uniref:UEV domain-containing protein n=1 Tax=Paramecium primaurelia TaxID=5886 RepID=A0A8S1KR65_PARPR|nr:unnamed protein product [Paramecium primaurelia]
MYNNNTEKNIYSPDNPQFKQKVYELQLIMDQCKYTKKNKVIEDAKIVLLNFKELNPTLTALNITMLELQGNIPIPYNNSIFSIFIHLRFQTSHPEVQPFIFLKNVDPNKFDANPLYKSAEIQNGLFITFNNFIPSVKNWNKNYKIIDFMLEIQSALSRNFPFFLKTNPYNYNQSQFQYNPQQMMNQGNQSQFNNYGLWQSQIQQPQFVQQQQQSLQNPYSQIQQKQQSQQQQSQNIQQQDKQQKKQQQEETGMANKLLQMSTSVFEFGKELFMNQEAKEEKIKTEVKSKVDIELLNQSKKLMDSIRQQKQLTDNLIEQYQQQTKVMREIKLKDEEINTSIHKLDQQLSYMEQKIESCVTTISKLEQNNIEELMFTDPLSNQIIDLTSEIQAQKEGLFYVQKKFRYQNLDYDQLIKITRQMSQQMFDQYLLLKKCVTSKQ